MVLDRYTDDGLSKLIAPSGGVYQAGTYSGNPLSVAAGLATLGLLKQRGKAFYAEMEQKCQTILKPLTEMISVTGLDIQINHVASMFQLFFNDKPVFDYSSAKASNNHKFMDFHAKLMKMGVFLPPSQFETCFLSAAHSAEDLKKTIECFSSALPKAT